MQGFHDSWIPAEAINYDEERSRQAFQDGNALFMRNWPYAYQLLASEESPVADKFGVTTLPYPSALGGWNIAISQCSKNLRTAYDFINYLIAPDTQLILFEKAGYAPARKSLYSNPDLRQKYPYLDALHTAVMQAKNRPVKPIYLDISELIQENLQPAVDNNGYADQVIDSLAEDLKAVLEPG